MTDWCLEGLSCPHGRIDPGGRKWVITWERRRCDRKNVTWECYTDVPICLFAYVGYQPAWKRRGTHEKRGIVMHHAPEVYCKYHYIQCQEEHDETTHHTFTFELDDYDTHLWWRCGGMSLGPFGRWSASRSPCYGWICETPPEPIPGECQPLRDGKIGNCQYWNANAQTFTPSIPWHLTAVDAHLKQCIPTYYGPYTIKITDPGGNCWAEPVLTSFQFDSHVLPTTWAAGMTRHDLPPIDLLQDHTYRLVIHTLPGWFPHESYACIAWGRQSGNPYTRGKGWYNCNFRDRRAVWYPTFDATFCIMGFPL